MFSTFLSNLLKGLEIAGNFDRSDRIKDASELMKSHQFEEALDILENLRHSPEEKSIGSMFIFLCKAICYAELDYKRSAQNCIKVVLSADRLSLNPTYQLAYSNMKKLAEEIKQEYKL